MATVLDISVAITSALTEIGKNGRLDLRIDGAHSTSWLGCPTGDDYEVVVTLTPWLEADRNEDG